VDELLRRVSVINVGLAAFAAPIAASGAAVTTVDWSPPGADPQVAADLAFLAGHARVEAANEAAFRAFSAAEPVLEGVAPASEVVPGMQGRMLLHAGPPIDWERMCGAMRGAAVGAILLEGWARNAEEATRLAQSGEVTFDSCHHHRAVGPMAGITSPSMPVWRVRNATQGNLAFSSLNEGLGKVLRYGAHSEDVLERLRWMRRVLAPALAAAIEASGPIELKPLMARALHMGDELHNRNAAASALLFKRLAPALVRSHAREAAAVLEFINGNDHFFLNVSMAACKAQLDAASGIHGSSMLVAMARNGTEFGIRLSGTPDRWYTTEAPVPEGLFFPGYGRADAGRDIGDSAITETAGLGGFAMAAAPAIVQFVGGSAREALGNTLRMRDIVLGSSTAFTLPPLDFAGAPAGIDARKVVDTGILPVINTGIAHREAGVGQIGAGITHAPLACFTQAVRALAAALA
jgi:hypothetical protein